MNFKNIFNAMKNIFHKVTKIFSSHMKPAGVEITGRAAGPVFRPLLPAHNR